ncbi:hypothetical protein [Sphingobacterium sp. HMA12]|uniref:hypothetical protein n=1 Tax=Sphingobacterium sp. HMA12 TaxID=2050894 RepID=UPI000CE9FAF3|nr:hypothetical protein [Sphingobacterium sp. HMA12]
MKSLYLILLLLVAQIVYSQTPQGHYEGALTRNGSVQLISFDFNNDKTTYDIPEIGYMNVTTEKIALWA